MIFVLKFVMLIVYEKIQQKNITGVAAINATMQEIKPDIKHINIFPECIK